MKNKLMILVLAAALLIGLCPVISAYANTTEIAYTIEDYKSAYDALSDELKSDLDTYPYVFGVSKEGYISFLLFNESPNIPDSFCYDIGINGLPSVVYSNVNHNGGRSGTQYLYRNGEWKQSATIYFFETDEELSTIKALYYDTIYNRMSESPYQSVLDSPYMTGFPTLNEFLNPVYTFEKWCVDASLNCQASSNENSGVIPYSYNSYWHIVRKTSNGKWLLTTIGNSVMAENISDYRLYIEDNGNLHVASVYGGENANGYKLNVRQYEYDADGWKLRTYETFDTREYSGIVDLGAGSGFDGVRMLAYTNVDIYVGTEYEPTYPKSTEYYEVTTTPPTEEPEEPSVTPDPSGDGVGGGNDVVVPEFDIDWNNVKLADIPQIIEQVKDAMLGFFDIVGVVPLMIGAVFGFLPSWCLWMFGLSFALLGVLLVIKLIRG